MAEQKTKAILSLCATQANKLRDLAIKDGQLIFMHDVGRIALDFQGKRTIYNQIIELDTEQERQALTEPVNGKYYFIIDTAVFWRYDNGWTQITSSPQSVLFIGTEMPELGKSNTLYVDKRNKEISVWNDTEKHYEAVSNYIETTSISEAEIIKLFQ